MWGSSVPRRCSPCSLPARCSPRASRTTCTCCNHLPALLSMPSRETTSPYKPTEIFASQDAYKQDRGNERGWKRKSRWHFPCGEAGGLTFAALAVGQEAVPSRAGAAVGAGEVDAGVGAEPRGPLGLVHLALVDVCGDTRCPCSAAACLGGSEPTGGPATAYPGRGWRRPCRSCGSRAHSGTAGSAPAGRSAACG